MSILGDRIKKEREDLGLSREELASKIGVSYSAISMYERGEREPNNELLLKFCDTFNCTTDYLIGKSNQKLTFYDFFANNKEIQEKLSKIKLTAKEQVFVESYMNKLSELILNLKKEYSDLSSVPEAVFKQRYKQMQKDLNYNMFSFSALGFLRMTKALGIILKAQEAIENESSLNFSQPMETINLNFDTAEKQENFYMCPVYGRISAGQPNWAEECIEGRIPIDPELMDIINPEEYFFLRVNGESMNKVVKNGAYALIHKQDMVENGEIAVVLVNGDEATLKHFSKKGDIIVLTPESDDTSFEQQIYSKETLIQIIGKYVGKMEMNK